ncbi:MAG: hypothetical protein WC759_04550 [Candidatus Micrarchaeia archaeon]|jgi:hypothetical protein
MVELNPWLMVVAPTALAAGVGALIHGVRERLRPNSDSDRVTTSAIFGAIIWGGITLAVTSGFAILASTMKGAGEMGETFRMFNHSDASPAVEKKEVRADAAKAVFDDGKCGQWMKIERNRANKLPGKVQVRPLGKPMFTAGSRRAC